MSPGSVPWPGTGPASKWGGAHLSAFRAGHGNCWLDTWGLACWSIVPGGRGFFGGTSAEQVADSCRSEPLGPGHGWMPHGFRYSERGGCSPKSGRSSGRCPKSESSFIHFEISFGQKRTPALWRHVTSPATQQRKGSSFGPTAVPELPDIPIQRLKFRVGYCDGGLILSGGGPWLL